MYMPLFGSQGNKFLPAKNINCFMQVTILQNHLAQNPKLDLNNFTTHAYLGSYM